ncbi:methionine ABC transporter permease [Erysipelothrix urinaevulpis]|uniref:methionine ABC transporter permease n=1 Tax=Erysipelothrix urinaevulpis TaxID=2683717 RepID=UPI001F29557F|nr:methionine ABC transporter permease [Erysipelothrix urinaevulpis]
MSKSFPNLILYWDEFWTSILETLSMMAFSGIFVLALGLLFGVILTITRKGGLKENRSIYEVLDKLINIFRSIPFVIFSSALIPLTRAVVGTPLGVKGAIIPLVLASSPFFARQVDLSLSEIDEGLIEAALSMGDSTKDIIFKVYLREGLASIIQGFAITIISLFGLTTISGTLGAGGLGAFVQRYGHAQRMGDITIASLIVIILFVSFIQGLAKLSVKLLRHS